MASAKRDEKRAKTGKAGGGGPPSSSTPAAVAEPEGLPVTPAVKDWLRRRIDSSDAELRNGPGGSWKYNETLLPAVTEVNTFLHALEALLGSA